MKNFFLDVDKVLNLGLQFHDSKTSVLESILSHVASLWSLFLVKLWVSSYNKVYIVQSWKARERHKYLTEKFL